jgi:hypothetical protein
MPRYQSLELIAMYTQNHNVESGEPNFLAFMGPGHVDVQIRQAIQFLWTIMPRDKKNLEDVEREFRRLVDRALRDLRDDNAIFGNCAQEPRTPTSPAAG